MLNTVYILLHEQIQTPDVLKVDQANNAAVSLCIRLLALVLYFWLYFMHLGPNKLKNCYKRK